MEKKRTESARILCRLGERSKETKRRKLLHEENSATLAQSLALVVRSCLDLITARLKNRIFSARFSQTRELPEFLGPFLLGGKNSKTVGEKSGNSSGKPMTKRSPWWGGT